MDMKLELVAIPVSDVDRAKLFYTEKVGFHADMDNRVSDAVRFVQLTPPGSGCSIAMGEGITTQLPGSVDGLILVVKDVKATYDELVGHGVEVTDPELQPWGTIHADFLDRTATAGHCNSRPIAAPRARRHCDPEPAARRDPAGQSSECKVAAIASSHGRRQHRHASPRCSDRGGCMSVAYRWSSSAGLPSAPSGSPWCCTASTSVQRLPPWPMRHLCCSPSR